jgi:hypothetical protein
MINSMVKIKVMPIHWSSRNIRGTVFDDRSHLIDGLGSLSSSNVWLGLRIRQQHLVDILNRLHGSTNQRDPLAASRNVAATEV